MPPCATTTPLAIAEPREEQKVHPSIESIPKAIQSISKRRQELHDLSNAELCVILKEIIAQMQDSEWEKAGDWLNEEARLLNIVSDGHDDKVNDDKDHDQANATDAAKNRYPATTHRVLSLTRQLMAQHILTYCTNLIKSLEYQDSQAEQPIAAKSVPVPPLLKSKRFVANDGSAPDDVKDDSAMTVYGPTAYDAAPGHTLEVWCNGDSVQKASSAPATGEAAAKTRSEASVQDAVCLVLGAGNQSFNGLVSVLHCIMSHRYPVILKHHPLREYLLDPVAVFFEPLMRRGYLHQIPDHGIHVTQQYLLANPLVQRVDLIGSWNTARAIEKTLATLRPHLSQPDIASMMCTELGGVNPFIVTPAQYTDAELRTAAKLFVTSRLCNRGANCLSNQVLLLPKEWPQKEAFRKVLDQELHAAIVDPAYYPGCGQRQKQLLDAYNEHGKATIIEATTVVPVSSDAFNGSHEPNLVVLECGTPGEEGYNNTALLHEAFSSTMAIVELPGGTSTDEYLVDTVVPFLNDKSNILGTLVAVVAHPKSVDKIPDKFVAQLKYTSLCVNSSSIFMYTANVCCGGKWGGHSSDENNPYGSSGRGGVGDIYALRNIERTVLYGPSLTATPLLDLAKPTPPILLDILHAVSVSKTAGAATMKILLILIVALIHTIVPNVLLEAVFGAKALKPYGGPF